MNWEKISSIKFGRLLPKLLVPLIVLVGGVALVLFYTESMPPQFEASARIWVQTRGVATTGSGDSGFLTSPLTSGQNNLITACEVMKSEAVMTEAHEYLSKRLPASECPDEEEISNGLDAQPVKDADIVTVRFRGPKAKIAKAIVTAVVDAFYRENNIQTAGNATQSKIYLQKQLKQAREQYKKTREDLRRFKEQNHAVDLEAQVGADLGQKSELENQIAATKQQMDSQAVQLKYLEKQLGFTAKDVMAFDAIAKDDQLKHLKTAIAENEVKLIQGRSKYQDEHPKMKHLMATLQESKQALANRMRAIIGKTDTQLELAGSASDSEVRDKMVGDIMDIKVDEVALTQKLISLDQQKKGLESRINVVPSQEIGLAELIRADGVAQSNVTSVEQELQSVSLTESVAMGTSNLQIIDPPSVYNQTSNIQIIGFIASVFLAGAVGAVQFVLDPRVINPQQVAGILNLPTNGWVPTRPKRGGTLNYLTTGLRKLLVQLKGNNSSNVLVVVSADPKDGKSTVCYAIAQSLAEMGSRVAVVDGNLARPTQHILFKQQASPGLVDCIGLEQANQVLKYMKPVRPNVALLPAGQHLDDESMSLKDATVVVEQLRTDFDFVLVDSPAGGLTFDGLNLPDCPHQLMVVSRLGCTRKNSLRLLAAQLQMHSEITAHSIINDIDEQSIAANLVADAAIISNTAIEKQTAPSEQGSVATW